MPNSSTLPPKFCPRCGSFYRDLGSTTCPQCFAHLEVLDAATAEEIATVEHERMRQPEFQERKAVADEQFKEQAFGGCLGVGAIVAVTIALAVIIIVAGMHRRVSPLSPPSTVSFANPASVVPPTLAGEKRLNLTGTQAQGSTLFPVVHALYAGNLEVFAAPSDLSPTLELAFSTSAGVQFGAAGPRVHDETSKHGAHYIVYSPSNDTTARAINELAQ